MTTKILRLIACLPLLMLMPLSAGTNLGNILTLGDSITEGFSSSTGTGYREPLYQKLTADGYTFQMVGSSTEGYPGSTILNNAGQAHHEGHLGYYIGPGDPNGANDYGTLDAGLSSWYSVDPTPNYILLHIGTNDFWGAGDSIPNPPGPYDIADAPTRLSNLIDRIAGEYPNAHIIVAQIIPVNSNTAPNYNPQINSQISTYNSTIPAMVAAKQAAGKHVTYVDMYDALNAATDISDEAHPNNGGYAKMANVWAAELETEANSGITGTQLLANPSAEADAVNPSPLTTGGYNPASWNVNNAMVNGTGSRNFTVTSGGSPFSVGNNSMLWVDTTADANTGNGVTVYQTAAQAAPANATFSMTVDFNCSTSATRNDLWIYPYGSFGGFAGVHITSNGSVGNIGANVGGSDHYLGDFTPGVWYQLTVAFTAPNAGVANATLTITPWNGTAPGTPTTYTVDGIPATESSGPTGLYLYTGAGPGASENMNLDNLGIVVNTPTPTGTQLLTNTSAETDTVNPSPLFTAGYNPASWGVNNAMTNGNGSRNFTVVSGASPFSAGNNSMLWVDTTAANTGNGVTVYQTAPQAAPADKTFSMAVDFKCNTSATRNDLWIFPYGSFGGFAGVHITSNGSGGDLGANVGGSDHFLAHFTPGLWYHLTVAFTAPNGGTANATLTITPWNGTAPGAPTAYTVDGIPAAESSGATGLYLYTGAGPGASENINLDNMGIIFN